MLNDMIEMVEGYGEWAHGGDLVDVAKDWIEAGFDVSGARDWLGGGCWDARSAKALRDAGMTAEQAGEYTEIGGCPAKIGSAVSNNDLNVEDAMTLIQ